jgi:formylglycine-generating enzyme required for sulfatase activity
MVDFSLIPGGRARIGSSLERIDATVAEWIDRLRDDAYISVFRDWIMKEYPEHEVDLDPFRIGRYPVTNGEYLLFVESTGAPVPESLSIGAPADHPVWGVSYEEAAAYADWRGAQSGYECRLPSEAEWEHAARGPGNRTYPFGDVFEATKCNTREAGYGSTTPVDRFPSGASGYGVFDLGGNVEEWTSSFYEPYPGASFVYDDIAASAGARYRVLRGGSFALGGDLARCARRHGPHPASSFRFRGFRLAASC